MLEEVELAPARPLVAPQGLEPASPRATARRAAVERGPVDAREPVEGTPLVAAVEQRLLGVLAVDLDQLRRQLREAVTQEPAHR